MSGVLDEGSELMPACRDVLETVGKQLRPRLVFNAAHLGAAPDDDAVARAAIAVELFHCASLAHDDVVDDSTLRRGRLTVGAAFGNSGAVLTGGWLFAKAASLAAGIDDAATLRFANASCEVCEGQMEELLDLYHPGRTKARYLGAVAGKTAALFDLSAHLGAACGMAAPDAVRAAGRYGSALGTAFQILDDIGDLVLGEAVTGKPRGNDLLHGVYTLPVLYALEERPELATQLSRHLTRADVGPLVEAIRDTRGPLRAVEDARRYRDAALEAVDGRPGAEGLRQLLDDAVSAPLADLPVA